MNLFRSHKPARHSASFWGTWLGIGIGAILVNEVVIGGQYLPAILWALSTGATIVGIQCMSGLILWRQLIVVGACLSFSISLLLECNLILTCALFLVSTMMILYVRSKYSTA